MVYVYANNSFNKPQNCLNYSLYYFEIKYKFEDKFHNSENQMLIGLKNSDLEEHIFYSPISCGIYYIRKEEAATKEKFMNSRIPFNYNDVFGCGLVYPPTYKLNEEFPYVFFTKNGEMFGKGFLLKDNFDSFKPFVKMACYSIEANFGNNSKISFKYDISKHKILKEFY
ncbi:unnamed protein product [Meloidogyne enterolobii]|uniref:Uncharacterized protein n=1 Tax=Meloidogyne enterolobii TaxID=390850 RepID=A0ACB0ZBC7_MELEN